MNPLIVALDMPDLDAAHTLAARLEDHVAGFKVGLELLMASGPSSIEKVASLGLPVFADAKLHDIPNTVRKAARQVSSAGARWLTVHASGGGHMIEAANDGMGGTGVLVVTVLTSLEEADLAGLGIGGSLENHIRILAGSAADAGAEGVVCSPAEARTVKQLGRELSIFTPGVRPVGTDHHDQARVASPLQAIEAGADYLVVGRPITSSNDPVSVAMAIVESVSRAY